MAHRRIKGFNLFLIRLGLFAHDAEVVYLLQVLRAEPDRDAKDTLYSRINEIFRRDIPVTFLFPAVENSVPHRRIRGLRRGGLGFLPFPDEVWIEEGNR